MVVLITNSLDFPVASKERGDALPKYFFWIDALRGLAAASVMIFHYQHFYLTNSGGRTVDIPSTDQFPYTAGLWLIYDHGGTAVRLFWVISGFVFAHVYLNRKSTIHDFAVARFSRLYPLHFATLFTVAALQLMNQQVSGQWQIYGNNDLRHFLLQLLMSDQILHYSRGLSFNGPIWSVSAEIGAYALFFVTLSLTRHSRIVLPLLLSGFSFFIVATKPDLLVLQPVIFNCAGYFFAGSALFGAFAHLILKRDRIFIFAAVLFVFTLLASITGYQDATLLFASCLLILCLAMADKLAPISGQWFKSLGNISYSLYLIHVPIQLIILLVADYFFAGTRSFAGEYWLLPVYVGMSIVVAFVVNRAFEKPLNNMLRARLSRK